MNFPNPSIFTFLFFLFPLLPFLFYFLSFPSLYYFLPSPSFAFGHASYVSHPRARVPLPRALSPLPALAPGHPCPVHAAPPLLLTPPVRYPCPLLPLFKAGQLSLLPPSSFPSTPSMPPRAYIAEIPVLHQVRPHHPMCSPSPAKPWSSHPCHEVPIDLLYHIPKSIPLGSISSRQISSTTARCWSSFPAGLHHRQRFSV